MIVYLHKTLNMKNLIKRKLSEEMKNEIMDRVEMLGAFVLISALMFGIIWFVDFCKTHECPWLLLVAVVVIMLITGGEMGGDADL